MFKRGRARAALALGLDRNPLCRGTDRAQAWIRAGLLAVFLIAAPGVSRSDARFAAVLTAALTLAAMALV